MLPMGMRYDYYLKIETMPHWYEALIDLLDLRDEARYVIYGTLHPFTLSPFSNGWDYISYWRPAVNGMTPDKCFYTTPGKSCKDMFINAVNNTTINNTTNNVPTRRCFSILTNHTLLIIDIRLKRSKKKIRIKNSDSKVKDYLNDTSVLLLTSKF